MRPRPGFAGGAVLVGAAIAAALLSLLWTPYPVGQIRIALKLAPPLTPQALLGADNLGRDLLSLVMAGTGTSLAIAAAAVAIGMAVGVPAGLLAAERRGLAEEALMRASDVLFAFPAVLTATMLAAFLGGGAGPTIAAIAAFNAPVFARLTRALAIGVLARDFARAARAIGRSGTAIALVHVLPNIAGLLIVQATTQLALAILAEAGLSYLGLGLAPPTPSLGRMLADAQTYMGQAPHVAIVPGAAIALLVLGLNLLGEGARDRLDPRGDAA